MWGIAVIRHHDLPHLIPRIVHVDEGISEKTYEFMKLVVVIILSIFAKKHGTKVLAFVHVRKTRILC